MDGTVKDKQGGLCLGCIFEGGTGGNIGGGGVFEQVAGAKAQPKQEEYEGEGFELHGIFFRFSGLIVPSYER